MTNELRVQLAKAATTLYQTNRPAWEAFMEALSLRAAYVTTQCISSPTDSLPQAQGRAQEARALVDALVEAPLLAEKLLEQERTNARANRVVSSR